MRQSVETFLKFIKSKAHYSLRKEIKTLDINTNDFAFFEKNFENLINQETPLIYQNDIFGFNKSISNGFVPLDDECFVNFTPDYAYFIDNGLENVKKDLEKKVLNSKKERKEYFQTSINIINLIYKICEKYKKEAIKQNITIMEEALNNVPYNKPRNYYEALLFLKILIYVLKTYPVRLMGYGRFDQYLYPYFILSMEQGVSYDELLEQTELFFLSLNVDEDLFANMQPGDDGQSLILGGLTKQGTEGYNKLSEIVIKSSIELSLINPKINLRVNKNTPLELYEFATHLTKRGLGFPQYCNDDIVIPGLMSLGYDYEDAIEYTVAACWEFIIPGVGYDIANIATMNFPKIVRNATMKHLHNSKTYEDFFNYVLDEMNKEFSKLQISSSDKGERFKKGYCPFISLFFKGCRDTNLDKNEGGAKYNNYGVHGLGIAPAVDALAAIKKGIFIEKKFTKEELIEALNNNFENYQNLRKYVLNCPKMGNNDDFADIIYINLIDKYQNLVNNHPNNLNGVYRAGTGGPQDYVYMSKDVGATADGRLAGSPYPSSFSPSLGIKPNGPLSIINSFTKYDMKKIINGGPLTLEVHDSIFKNDEGIQKVALLVKSFIDLGGHQLQINSINREKLLDAQKHPENYSDLIVRVWGWSGYFVELDLCFQNQIISRVEYENI